MMLARYEPFRELMPLREAMDRLVQDSLVRPFGWMGGTGVPVDVEETDDAYVVTASLPGWKPEDVNVTVQEGTLTISGEHQEPEQAEQGTTYHLRERRVASFRRSISFPVPVEADKAQASYENGVLTLTLPKAESAKPKAIKIGANGQKQIAAGTPTA
jgi:HSP20 family protein